MKFMTNKNEICMVSEKLRVEIGTMEVSRISYMNLI